MTNADAKLSKAIEMARTKKGWEITITIPYAGAKFFRWYLFSRTGKYAHSFGIIWLTENNEKNYQDVLNFATIIRGEDNEN